MRAIKGILSALISLLVDDGFLAAAALVAIGIVWLVARDGVIGPTETTGWMLFTLLAVSVAISCRRAVRRYLVSASREADTR